MLHAGVLTSYSAPRIAMYLQQLTLASFLFISINTACADIELKYADSSFVFNPQTLESWSRAKFGLGMKRTSIEQHENYVSLHYELINLSDANVTLGPLEVFIGGALQVKPDARAGFGASFYDNLDPFLGEMIGGGARKVTLETILNSPTLLTNQWFGWASRHQVELIRFENDAWEYRLLSSDSQQLTPGNLSIELKPKHQSLSPGESISVKFDYVDSPKSTGLLDDPQINLEGILFMNLWPWFRAICLIVWSTTDFLFQQTASWGLSLILLALVIRVITYPITRFSLTYQKVSLQQQTQIAPLLQKIKDSFSGVARSEKIIELYENQNYDHLAPFKSLLGLFIQIPIFAALFSVLGEVWEISGQSFYWIEDLSKSDRLFDWGINIPYFGSYFNLLPVILATTTTFSNWLASKHAGNGNHPGRTIFAMGGIFFVVFYSFPAALLIYWVASNLFQLIQQSVENYFSTLTPRGVIKDQGVSNERFK